MPKKKTVLGPQVTPLRESKALPEKYSIAEKWADNAGIKERADKCMAYLDEQRWNSVCAACEQPRRVDWYRPTKGTLADVEAEALRGHHFWFFKVYLGKLKPLCAECGPNWSNNRNRNHVAEEQHWRDVRRKSLKERNSVKDVKAWRLARLWKSRAMRETDPAKRPKYWALAMQLEARAKQVDLHPERSERARAAELTKMQKAHLKGTGESPAVIAKERKTMKEIEEDREHERNVALANRFPVR